MKEQDAAHSEYTFTGWTRTMLENEITRLRSEKFQAGSNSDRYIPTKETDPDKVAASLRGKLRDANRELTRLRSELQQKDEIIEVLKRGMQKGSEIYAHLRFDDEPFTPYQLALQEIEKLKSELQRERELRNELLTPKKQS